MIKAVRQMLGRTAVALIEPNRVEAGGEGLVGEPAHVVRIAGAFEAVQARSAWDAPTAAAANGSARARACRERRRTSEAEAAAARGTCAVFPTRTGSSNGPPSSGGGERIRRLSLRSRDACCKRIRRETDRCGRRPGDRRRARRRGSRDRSARRARAVAPATTNRNHARRAMRRSASTATSREYSASARSFTSSR